MDMLKKILEKQSQIWVLVIGFVIIVFGFYEFFRISGLEDSGQPVRMKKILEYVYNFGGKYTILAIFEAVGLAAVISGILQLRNRL